MPRGRPPRCPYCKTTTRTVSKGIVGACLFARKRMVVDFDKRRVRIEESIP